MRDARSQKLRMVRHLHPNSILEYLIGSSEIGVRVPSGLVIMSNTA